MAKLTKDQWESIRAERETVGTSFPDLAARYGVTHQAIQRRSKAEGWSDGKDVNPAIARKVAEKIAGVVAGDNPQKKAEAIDAEAERRAQVRLRHRKECEQVAALRQEAITERKNNVKEAFEKAKLAKILSESLSIQHACECKAWNLDVPDMDVTKMTDAQLQQIIQGKMPK